MITKETIRESKIKIKGSSESKRVQEKLFELECDWNYRTEDKRYYCIDGEHYIYIDSYSSITYGQSPTSFTNKSYKEITVEELLDMNKEYTISEEFIKEAHKAACSTWKTRIENQFPEVFPKPYKVGQMVIAGNYDTMYKAVLVAVNYDNDVVAVCLDNYNRFEEPVRVKNINNITLEEMKLICGKNFKLKQ